MITSSMLQLRKLENKIPNSNIDPLSYLGRLPNSFVLLDTSETEVLSVIKSLRNKRGDCFTNQFLISRGTIS